MKYIFASAMILIALTSGCDLYAQAQPIIYQLETPYLPLAQPVKMFGHNYGAGLVSYGPVGTPVVIYGANFSDIRTPQVTFPGTRKGTMRSAVVQTWSANTITVTVPSGATTGYVSVTVFYTLLQSATSNYVPFLVTNGSYSGSCPVTPSSSLLTITTTSLPSGTQSSSYSTTLQATGGQPPYTWSQSGSLPSGLSLNGSTGVISGTPTWSGTDNIIVAVTDSANASSSATLSLLVNPVTPPASASSVTYTYDSQGRINTAQYTTPNGTITVTYSYDSAGNRTSVVTQ